MNLQEQDPDTAYFLVLAGGGWRGGVQYWVIRHLVDNFDYAAIYGVSVGSVNGVMAAMGKMEELLEFWQAIDGLKGFLRTRWLYAIGWVLGIVNLLKKLGVRIIGGFYSMEPLKEKLTDYVHLEELKTPFVAGVISFNSGKYYNLDSRDVEKDHRLVNTILGSACMAPYMQPPLMQLERGGERELAWDGGGKNIFPIPFEEIAAARAEGKKVVIHAVGCTPMDRVEQVSSRDVDDPLEMSLRAVEIMLDEIFDGDFTQMREAVGPEGEVLYWLPSFDTGATFDADKATIQARLAEGQAMWDRGPKRLKGLGS